MLRHNSRDEEETEILSDENRTRPCTEARDLLLYRMIDQVSDSRSLTSPGIHTD